MRIPKHWYLCSKHAKVTRNFPREKHESCPLFGEVLAHADVTDGGHFWVYSCLKFVRSTPNSWCSACRLNIISCPWSILSSEVSVCPPSEGLSSKDTALCYWQEEAWFGTRCHKHPQTSLLVRCMFLVYSFLCLNVSYILYYSGGKVNGTEYSIAPSTRNGRSRKILPPPPRKFELRHLLSPDRERSIYCKYAEKLKFRSLGKKIFGWTYPKIANVW